MSPRGKAEVRAVTGVLVVLFGSVGLCAVIPGLEHVLNVTMSCVAGVVVLIAVGIVVRDLFL